MAPERVAGLIEFHAVETESLIFRTYCIFLFGEAQEVVSREDALMQVRRFGP